MDSKRFDEMTKAITIDATSRRRVLRGLLGATGTGALALLGLGGQAGAQETAAADIAAAGCLKEGKTCKRGNQCCSGVCKGGKCRETPFTGTCTIRQDVCAATGSIGEGPKCNGVAGCECITTKSGAAFCREIGGAACTSCDNDQDCAFAVGPGAKCIAGKPCGFPCTREVENFCAVPCGFESRTSKQGAADGESSPAAV